MRNGMRLLYSIEDFKRYCDNGALEGVLEEIHYSPHEYAELLRSVLEELIELETIKEEEYAEMDNQVRYLEDTIDSKSEEILDLENSIGFLADHSEKLEQQIEELTSKLEKE